MFYVLTVAMQKGGCAKTTTALCLAQAANAKGKKVLAIDLDPQGNLTYAMGADARRPGAYELIEGQMPADKLTQHCGGVDVIPASQALATEQSGKGTATRLRKALAPVVGKYDYVIIDTPTLASEMLYNALNASNGLIIPTEADIFNLQSIYQVTNTAQIIQGSGNNNLHVLGYVVTKADNRSTIARQMQEHLTSTGVPCMGTVRNAVAIKEAQALQANIYEYAPNSKPALDYMALFEKIDKQANG